MFQSSFVEASYQTQKNIFDSFQIKNDDTARHTSAFVNLIMERRDLTKNSKLFKT